MNFLIKWIPNKNEEILRKSARLEKIRLLKQTQEIKSGVSIKRKKSDANEKWIKKVSKL